jgi:Pyruvate/2-oxoacid:ferredoxin oxidoreductase gamma subunit
MEKFPYPSLETIVDLLAELGVRDILKLQASEIALRETGSIASVNMVMLGAGYSTGMIPVEIDSMETAISQFVPEGTEDRNVKAFRVGIDEFRTLRTAQAK